MGYLHAGHLSLVAEARRRSDRVVASIFVNPTQFGPTDDLSTYPRDEQGDLDKLRGAGVDAVFVPEPKSVYPAGFDTYVVPDKLAQGLCGASRPRHFRGVCTVVLLLFRMSRCQVAVFGEKDFQQLAIIRRMAKDLWLDVEVVGSPIVREADGLAMSSRNVYLSEPERREALSLSRALQAARQKLSGGERRAEELLDVARRAISETARLDYLSLVDRESLEPLSTVDRPALLAVAAFFGKTRLIDNLQL